ncbi:MAG: hypothetical protein A2538_00120 [Candidatus Magasanikbacteria bacterium RIFOXYD2_FULL_41_14]|uniref:Phosphomannomutase n=1 Tax=Candidatus Magasanikbacteria bacterium RIFOXYD2_FULL_41_14 TaxID=1798709 RepID=A0A1F6PEF0_9BACT|nr:MAG: hypothetical protein A2538_00120 [Candidatus Magasanikbacteria bacterium RIFOXYD2_FULL_41_14]
MQEHIPDHVFRGYDLRGLAGSELTYGRVKSLGRGYATWLIQRRIKDCTVGYDCRLSSMEYRDALVAGLIESGIDVYDIGLTLTQISYFSNYFFRTKGAVMITASHNPKEYNGFKFGTGYSETMNTEDIVGLRELVKSGKFLNIGKVGGHIRQDITEDYFKDISRFVGEIRKFKVVVDACAGTAGLFLPEILRRAGCEVIEQNTKPDGNFPVGTPDPTEREVQERLAERVVKEGADIGFSYDCDGDRLGVVDEKGNLLWNDVLLSLYAQDSLEFQPGAKIVYNNLCSKQVDEVISAAGGVPIIWKTGHSFIKAKVKESGAVFGGELSGHFYFVDNFYGHDDSAIASLRILSYLTRTKQTLSEAVAKLPKYISSPEIKVGYPDNLKFAFVKDQLVVELKKLYPDAKFNEIDGVRMDSESEMIVMRASQNGPYLTIKFEARAEGIYNKIKIQINDLLHNYQEIDFAKGANLAALK